MKKLHMLNKISILILLTTIFPDLHSQIVYKIKPDKSSMIIKGTSTLHNWEENVVKFSCTLDLSKKETHPEISSVNFLCKDRDIKSDYSLMDKKTMAALKSIKHPDITFKNGSILNMKYNKGNFSGNLTGDLSIAGITKKVNVSFKGNKVSDNQIRIEGEKAIDLKDFNIIPPVAMFGTLKTGNTVTVVFSFLFTA